MLATLSNLEAFSPPLSGTFRPLSRLARPVALLHDVLPSLHSLHVLAEATALPAPRVEGIDTFLSEVSREMLSIKNEIVLKVNGVQESADEMSRQLSTSLDAGRALRLDNGAQLSELERSLIDVFNRVSGAAAGGVDHLSENAMKAAASVESAVLDSIGHDVLIFLVCASMATPLAQLAGISPILMYLLFGALLGPHCLNVFSSSEAGVELGDFGILFLLFSEGLE